jgi:DNA/RNA-binding domain of Phe-tRNA-synthetase-like protein
VGCEGEARGLVSVEAGARELGVAVVYAVYEGPPAGSLDPRLLDGPVEEAIREAASKYSLEGLRGDPVAGAYRRFYWRIGVDPTKTRPSGEALARRALRGRFPRINPVVDAGNIASLATLVPIGLYDLGKARPPLRLTLSRGGEEFHPIGGKPERLRAGLPILVDSTGLVMHLYPHRDSVHTAVSESTRRVLALMAGVPGVPRSRLLEALHRLEAALAVLGWRRASGPCSSPGP